MSDDTRNLEGRRASSSVLTGPKTNPAFAKALDELVSLGRQGQKADSEFFNPPNDWLINRMPILQDLPPAEQARILEEAQGVVRDGEEANAAGRAAYRAWPSAVVRLDTGGLGFFSQLGVIRRPDLTQYFIDGFDRNRDAQAFDEANQALFAEVFSHIIQRMKEHFEGGNTIIQSDRQICDAPGRSFHARQLLFGSQYLQVPIMWRQLTFDLPPSEYTQSPDILEITLPNWLEDLGLPEDLKGRIREAGLTQLILKAPTKGLSLHLGFDYVGEHKMGPLSITMFLVKQRQGLAIQAALSVARAKSLTGQMKNTAMVTVGPSLHGKSTLTIMIELANSELAKHLNLPRDPDEGVYPMNDDIVLLQPLPQPIEVTRGGQTFKITHGIDGTENNFYAMPFGLDQADDPITYAAVRGTEDSPNKEESLENVPVDVEKGIPNFLENPVRNMRVILSRPRLLDRKKARNLIRTISNEELSDSVHVPMEHTDRVFWQEVMRQNTVIPPLRRLSLEQYIRVLMYGEAVQMGAAVGAIGSPYVEYFSDPFIIGLEDENANLMYSILHDMAGGGLPQEYYVFNTGGVGADTNEQASGDKYKKIPRELTLMLQEALLREAVKFEYDPVLGSDVAVAIVDAQGEEVVDLRAEWLPVEIYGADEYNRRMLELTRRRYYGRDSQDKAGILRYTKTYNAILDPDDIPPPNNERELAWLLSFYWSVDQACDTLQDLARHCDEGQPAAPDILSVLQEKYRAGLTQGLKVPADSQSVLSELGISP